MSRREDYEKKTEELITPIIDDFGFELVDVEYVKEGSNMYLRAYVDKEGGITIDDLEKVSRKFNEILDKEDYIADPYIFEVSSPGLGRAIKKDKDFLRNLDKMIEIHLYKAKDGFKEYIGILKKYDDESVTIDIDDETFSFGRKEISLIREYIEF